MFKLRLLLLSALLLSGFGFAQKVGSAAPDFTLVNDAGETIGPSDFLGTPYVLNAWATWCTPCIEELPFFQRIFDEVNTDADEPLLNFLLVNNNENAENALPFLRNELEISLATGVDASKEQREQLKAEGVELDKTLDVIKKYRIRGMPTTFFIDADGVIQAIKVGFITPAETEGLLASIGIDWSTQSN